MRKLANGAGQEDVVYEADTVAWVDDWSANGRYMLIGRPDARFSNDLWLLTLDVPPALTPLVRTPGDDPRARLSPNGKLVSYISNQSGRMEAYVLPFPSLDGKWQISPQGANTAPQWRSDGRELYYIEGSTMVAAAVISENPLRLAPEERLFTVPPTPRPYVYSVAPDGKRFMFAVDQPVTSPPKYHVIVNWTETDER